MLAEQINTFREMVTLKDGAYILLRALTHEDKNRLKEFYGAVTDEDLRYFRHQLKDDTVISNNTGGFWRELMKVEQSAFSLLRNCIFHGSR